MNNVICYRTNKPVVYNAGTKYETSCDHFLLCYMYGMPINECEAIVKDLNERRPSTYKNIYIEWKRLDIKELYVSQQDAMQD